MESYCVRAFADALEVVPFTLAENAGLNPIAIVTELRNRHAQVPGPKRLPTQSRRSEKKRIALTTGQLLRIGPHLLLFMWV